MSIQGAINKALGTAGAYSAIKGRLEDVKEEKSKPEKQTLAKKPKQTVKGRLEDVKEEKSKPEKKTLAKKPKQTVDVLAKNPISSGELIAKMKKANERAKERKEAKQQQARNYSANLIYGGVRNGNE